MSLQDSLFSEDVENDVNLFHKNQRRKRVLIFPPVNNYRRFLIHQLVQDHFSDLLHTFSIGQGYDRRTVVCYKNDLISDPKSIDTNQSLNAIENNILFSRTSNKMGVEEEKTMSIASPEHARVQRQVKSIPAIEIYRPPAARKAKFDERQQQCSSDSLIKPMTNDSFSTKNRQKRPDRAVYVPRHRRSTENEQNPQAITGSDKTPPHHSKPTKSKEKQLRDITQSAVDEQNNLDNIHETQTFISNCTNDPEVSPIEKQTSESDVLNLRTEKITEILVECPLEKAESNESLIKSSSPNVEEDEEKIIEQRNPILEKKILSNILIISDHPEKEDETSKGVTMVPVTPPEKKVKKTEKLKNKPAQPPSPTVKLNRDECEWESLFNEDGDCLDPSLLQELTAAVGEVMIEQPKNNYKTYSKQVEVSSDEFAHVVEIYNFPSEFKTNDLTAIFSPFKNGGFELKWVDDTHCLGVFSSPLVAAEVLASNHPFIKTRPLSEATALSRTKARRSAEFLQPYRTRPETCAALARRLVTGALGVKLATASQEREHEKNILREAKEKKRLANKQREDVWEGIIPGK